MKIGTVKEIKTHEYRVGLTPACVKAYCSRGHEVFVEKDAGINDQPDFARGATVQKIMDACFKSDKTDKTIHVN